MKNVGISTEYITLGQLLKLADCIATGGEAKAFLQQTKVLVNGEPDNRRGRKLVPGDVVQVDGCGTFTVAAR
ncbi:S4 domain-containing protein YaaA [Cohnella caldifontis]|uniref:S4 domain-containing protein YaaA n=1 Tax=Cohnella caldifontis TaxID=3027471 RepID=UPI0023ED4620|nr:S4 domain-containing protein YaaA [Cohnella sp. YIM B05605]